MKTEDGEKGIVRDTDTERMDYRKTERDTETERK